MTSRRIPLASSLNLIPSPNGGLRSPAHLIFVGMWRALHTDHSPALLDEAELTNRHVAALRETRSSTNGTLDSE